MGQRDAEQAYRVCLESIGRIEHLVAELGDPCGFERKQSVYLATKRGEVDDLRAEHEARVKAGIRVEGRRWSAAGARTTPLDNPS